MKINFDKERFWQRHIGPDSQQIKDMLSVVGAPSLKALMNEVVPADIQLEEELELDEPMSEYSFLEEFRKLAEDNTVTQSFIGMGYHDTLLPNVIQRNVLENPGWYTAYTPYQAEISQGRLEALINFQTMVCDLTGMELANASLLDEGTAAGEAMSMIYSSLGRSRQKKAGHFFVSEQCHPQTIDVVKGRAEPQGIEVVVGDHREVDLTDPQLFGMLLQYPDTEGRIEDHTDLITAAHEHEVAVVVAADLLSLTLLKPPGEMGADVVVGSTQRFGVPMGYGGPHAAYFATGEDYKRQLPGRIIGVTRDREGNPSYRMALQTREQHIRREKATSNICTAQVLLAVIAGFYAAYHGPGGLQRIARRIHGLAKITHKELEKLGFTVEHDLYFDTLKVELKDSSDQDAIRNQALQQQVNFRYFDKPAVGIAFDEVKDIDDVATVLQIFAEATGKDSKFDGKKSTGDMTVDFPEELTRRSNYMDHPVFNLYHSEHEMLRYLKKLENRDLSLVHSMIPLGSCTMKLNASTEMLPLTWPEFSKLHPFAPQEQAKGYQRLFDRLTNQLKEITGLDAVSLQPNSGAQGEYAGLMAIRAYHRDREEGHRNV
ncbi:MAG: glycine dehydrogenase (aminomethyl-transferring), partial [Balneolaceae bacterium]|nr:glycine dehydrogenase (aminomethyl-transferring) [Balneolaceae bacterium]